MGSREMDILWSTGSPAGSISNDHALQYVRLGFDSEPDQILYLLEKIWDIERPKLVISVHGGIANFQLQPKLTRVFRKGLLKAAKTTGAWIITSGLNSGVVRHVAAALSDGAAAARAKNKIVTIGIAPWGLLKKRDDFIGKEVTVPYHPQAFSPKGRFAVLNDKHSYFLLVDNGTVGRYGADIILRKRFEEHVSKLRIESSGKRVPVVCVIVEGGTCTIRAVLDYVTNVPPVPVVVCDGSGRAADLIAFTHKYAHDDGSMPEALKEQLLCTIAQCFDYTAEQAEKVFMELMLCVRKRHLITVFRLGEDSQQDIDHAILTALLKGQDLSAPDQLSLALTWNRPDIAKADIFVYGQEWPPGSLESAMMDALIYDRVEFVKLLLENGVSMERFLTVQRLEELYNADKGPTYSSDALRLIIQDVVKNPIVKRQHRITLLEIGLVIQKLMGSAYRSAYCRKDFKRRSERLRTLKMAENHSFTKTSMNSSAAHPGSKEDDEEKRYREDQECHFKYPFNELFVWAVLLRRQNMALCMWQHGEEAMAKALVGCKLFKAMSKEASDDYLEVEICEELKEHSESFRRLSLELLEHCYSTDDDKTFQLLTYELKNWGNETCLSLAYLANHMQFIAHPGCQILLADLWHGGLRIRKNSNWRVLMGLLLPFTIFKLDFKTKEELLLQPQTKEEHIEEQQKDFDDSSLSLHSQLTSGSGNNLHEDGHESSDDLEQGKIDLDDSSLDSSSEGSDVITGENAAPRRSKPGKKTNILGGSRSSVSSSLLKHFAPGQSIRRKFKSSDPVVTPPKNSRPSHPTLPLKSVLKPSATVAQLTPAALKLGSPAFPALRANAHQKPKRPLNFGKRFYEFYVAPITTFWFFTLSYLMFLAAYTYVILVRIRPSPTFPEYFVIAYVSTFGLELVRKMFMSTPHNLRGKLTTFLRQRWNFANTVAVLTFLLGLMLRLNEATRTAGRLIYCVNISFWYLYTLDLLSVNKYLGPYITMVAKMIVTMIYMCTILLVFLMSFGVVRQALLFPNEEFFTALLIKNIFYKPYFMLYGEVYAGEIDTCGDQGSKCMPGHWLTPAFMAAFLLVANILLINLLIAAFNNIFNQVNAVAHNVWKFQRYTVVLEYEQKPWLPPPLIIIPLMFLMYKYICERNWHKKDWISDYGLKLFLNEEDVDKLHDFEEECMEELHCQKQLKVASSAEERIARTTDRVEFMSMKMDDMLQKYNTSKVVIQTLEAKLRAMEEVQLSILGGIEQIQAGMGIERRPVCPVNPPPPSPPPDGSGFYPRQLPAGWGSVPSRIGSVPRISKSTDAGPDSPFPTGLNKPKLKRSMGGTEAPRFYLPGSSPEKYTGGVASLRRRIGIPLSPSIINRASSAGPPSTPGTPRNPPPGTLMNLYSCPEPMSPAIGKSEEYTTITDSIDTSCLTEPQPDRPFSCVVPPLHHAPSALLPSHLSAGAQLATIYDRDDLIVEGYNNPRDRHHHRSSSSTESKASSLAKADEEYCGAIQGNLVKERLRKESTTHRSGKISVCVDEDLKEMGLSELELKDYLDCLNNSLHSSTVSLNSTQLEDKDGFMDISECLAAKALSGPSTPLLTPKVKPERHHRASSASAHYVHNGGQQSQRDNARSPKSTSVQLTPCDTPKAGLVFTFDAKDIAEHLRQAQEQQRREAHQMDLMDD